MKTRTLLRIVALAVLIGVISVPSAMAQARELSTWTITEPTDVGGTLLQPGSYRLTLVPTPKNQNMVRVTSADGSEIFATVLTVPNPLALNKDLPGSMFVYYPAVEGQPRALRTWYASYPASGAGHDIVYEQNRATMIARAAKTRVVSYRGTIEDPDTAELQVITPDAVAETYVVSEPRITTVETRPTMIVETRTELPQTAGNTPLFAFLGLLSLAGALTIRAIR